MKIELNSLQYIDTADIKRGVFVFPKGVTAIQSGVFFRCLRLKKTIIPEEVTLLDVNVFNQCKNLTEIGLPKQLELIGNSAFFECEKLTNVKFPEGLRSIGVSAFRGCETLDELVFPDTLTSIGEEGFFGCSGLVNVTLSKELTLIDRYVFAHCKKLTNITIMEKVLTINEGAFYNCIGLTEITLSEGLRSIDPTAFSGCKNLSKINIEASNEQAYERVKELLPEELQRKAVFLPKIPLMIQDLDVLLKGEIIIESDEGIEDKINEIQNRIEEIQDQSLKQTYQKDLDSLLVTAYLSLGQGSHALAYYIDNQALLSDQAAFLLCSYLIALEEKSGYSLDDKYKAIIHLFKDFAGDKGILSLLHQVVISLLSAENQTKSLKKLQDFNIDIVLPASTITKTIEAYLEQETSMPNGLKEALTRLKDCCHLLTAEELRTVLNTEPLKQYFNAQYGDGVIVSFESIIMRDKKDAAGALEIGVPTLSIQDLVATMTSEEVETRKNNYEQLTDQVATTLDHYAKLDDAAKALEDKPSSSSAFNPRADGFFTTKKDSPRGDDTPSPQSSSRGPQ